MKTILVTGAAGFIGTNLILKLLDDKNNKIIAIDNFMTGSIKNIPNHNNLTFYNFDICKTDVIDFILHNYEKIDEIYHLASIASPIHYKKHPLETLNVGYNGTKNILEIVYYYKSRFLFTSTSEIYGDPKEHPQKESYHGNVNCYGQRSCYDESKRVAESLVYSYRTLYNLDTKIVRIFNTYGPYMNIDDGRIITEIIKAIKLEQPLKINDYGIQTRSFSFVNDTIEMMINVMNSEYNHPINIGNDNEISINELIKIAEEVTNKKIEVVYNKHNDIDDPKVRKPCLSLYKMLISKDIHKTNLRDGFKETFEFFQK